MENTPILPENQWKSGEKKLILWVLVILGLAALIFFVLIPKFKSHFVPIPLSQTAGMNASAEFQFTLSPDNHWILYFEQKYPFYDQYNLVAFDTVNNKKFTIDPGDVNTAQLQLQIQNDCWSKDSRYCVLPIGISRTDPRMIERMGAIQSPADASWTKGNLLGESEFADVGGSVGLPNNAPDILIDFTNSTGPILKKQFFDYRLVDMAYRNQNISTQTNRLIFDTISPNGFTCSDCSSSVDKEKDFGGNSHGREYTSPDGKYVAQEISHGSGFVSPPDLYIKDMKTGSKTFIASNVYYDMHFTSDSSGLYYYGCKNGGACDAQTDHLFYVNFSKPQNSFSKNTEVADNVPTPQHTEEERTKDLEAIQQKAENEKAAVLKSHYDLLTEEFKTPQKIIGINGARIFTENHRPVLIIHDNIPGGSQYDKDMKYDSLIKSLIGKKVTIVLPSFEEFSKTYEGADKYDLGFFGATLWIYDANGKEVYHGPTPVDSVYKKYIWTAYANVYYNGELLSNQLK